ncbi:hypothetical protein H6F77_16560 [Microcoleus sp. FACHB-831]|uniref:hypothetical protein n=1 Tax=Microcoleus sp. FACHB-831 TaxID=2692827 RepID=UPI0016883B35|nr:hypothetical protein [Microcoleus sp. FACHB-831]MBD1922676.1 hypothetical protein [Microcoleus sp. FACHB-831]
MRYLSRSEDLKRLCKSLILSIAVDKSNAKSNLQQTTARGDNRKISWFFLVSFYLFLPQTAKANELSELPLGNSSDRINEAKRLSALLLQHVSADTVLSVEKNSAVKSSPIRSVRSERSEKSFVAPSDVEEVSMSADATPNNPSAIADYSLETQDSASINFAKTADIPSLETLQITSLRDRGQDQRIHTSDNFRSFIQNQKTVAGYAVETRNFPSLKTNSDRQQSVNPGSLTADNQQPTTDNQQPTTNDSPTPNPQSLEVPVRILTPQSGVIRNRSTNLSIQYSAATQVQVSVNKKPIDSKIQTQIDRNEAQNIVNQVWYNIPLEKGENTITVQADNAAPISLTLNVKETGRKIEIVPSGNARIPADGRSFLALEGRITDEKGELIREDARVTLTSSAGKFVGADEDKDEPGFQVVAKSGQFTAQLQSSLEAGKVKIRAAVDGKKLQAQASTPKIPSPEIPAQTAQGTEVLPLETETVVENYTQVEFITNLRPSLVSGVIDLRIGPRGTNFWGRRNEFIKPDLDKGTAFDASAAVFATGKVGEWLLTGAYNSARNLNETCDGITRLFRGPQFCEQNYPVYGDSSTVDYLTPSKDSVYVRLERTSPTSGAEPDYVMWGDYNTTEFARASQLFSATTRQLHGFKGNFSLGNLQLTAMYSPDVQGFQRDTIVPTGTSGYYFLSRRLLVEGSENVFLETEEINRPGTVLSRRPLYRGPDYEIDYERGTLLFRRPLLATELNPFGTTEVRRIVVTYQHEGAGENTDLYGGRLQYNFSQEFNRQSWVGASYMRENLDSRNFELLGADFLFPLGKNGQIVGEYARSTNDDPFLGNVTGNAYRVEAYGAIAPFLLGRGYYRSVEENFSNNATTSFTPGQTRYGANVAAQITKTTNLTASYDHEINFGRASAIRTDFFDIFNPQPRARPGERVDNSLTTIRAGLVQKFGAADLSLEYVNRDRDDRISDTFDGNASQLVSRLNLPLTQTITFRAQNELNLDGRSDPLYPNRTTLGLDWAAMQGVTFRLAHQFFDGGLFKNNSITSLDTLVDRQLGENTSITSRYSIISAFGSVTGQGAVGLNHRIVLAPGFRVHLGYEHIFNNLFVRTAAGQQFAQPYATGQSAASLGLAGGDAYSVGFEYTDNPDFQASARWEHRTGEDGSNTVISAGAAGKVSPALTALVRYQQANASNQLLRGLGDTVNLKLGLAYRDPSADQFNALLRYEYRRNPSTIPETLLLGSGTGYNDHLVAAEAIYAPDWRWEFYGKYAMRYSTTYYASDFSQDSMVYLAQARAAYKLGYRTDIAGEVRWIGQPSTGFKETGLAVEAGYYLTPDLRASLGYSFGSVDDRDFTGYRSNGGVYFGLTLKLNELLGGFGRQKVAPPQQQESIVKPVANSSTTSPANPEVKPEASSPTTPPANPEVKPEASSPTTPPANSEVKPEANPPTTPPANSEIKPTDEGAGNSSKQLESSDAGSREEESNKPKFPIKNLKSQLPISEVKSEKYSIFPHFSSPLLPSVIKRMEKI